MELQLRAQCGIGAVDLVTATHRAGIPAFNARISIPAASAGLVRNLSSATSKGSVAILVILGICLADPWALIVPEGWVGSRRG
jgi:hypothetical protein